MATGSVYIGAKYDANNQVYPSLGHNVVSVGYGSDAAGTGSIAIGDGAAADAFDNAGEGKNPDAKSQSIAIGNNAVAKQNNIAIGAGSVATATASTAKAYLTGQAAVSSYVSVGGGTVTTTDPKTQETTTTTTLRRITNVADGATASDVATVGQLQALSKEIGGYKADFGIQIDPDSTDKTKNTISLNRNLGTNYGNKYGNGKVTFEADGENSLILGGGAINDSWDERDKDFTFGAHAKDSVLVGGMNNDIDKNSERALIVGGTYNKTLSTGKVQQTGTDAIIVGGSSNKAEGDGSLLIGGDQNEASGLNSTIIGGLENKNESWDASILGGHYNQITGISQASGIFGGYNNKVVNSGFTYILGGKNNIADGGQAVIVGGMNNRSSGLGSSVFGGTNNIASGAGSSVIGGEYNAATNVM